MPKLDARKSGSFKIGGEIEIHRLGFGAMRITGPGIWGPPVDRVEAIHTLKRVPELGIDFIGHRRFLWAGSLRAADPRNSLSL
jgi:pyridoxine 4-dehydrogenase